MQTRPLTENQKAQIAVAIEDEKLKLLAITNDPSTWGDDLAEHNALVIARKLASVGVDISDTNISKLAELHARGKIDLNVKS